MADPAGVSVAFDPVMVTTDPAWQRLDTTYRVRSWSIDRGRQNEMTKTGTGTATVELVDRTGAFDPTNAGGAMHQLQPLSHAAIAVQSPVSPYPWKTLFRGYVSRLIWEPFQREDAANVTLELVDALAVFAAAEMRMDWGNDFLNGNIVFNVDTALTAVQTRINFILDKFGWPTGLRSIFTGNVALLESRYAPRSTVLQVIMDACDAEFPDIANVYIGGPKNPGKVVFHGRFARFKPADVSYGIQTFQVGDDAASAASPSDTVRISPPLQASLDDTLLYTSALATPQGIDDGDIAAQYLEDTTTSTAKGLRTWSAENLATRGGVVSSTDSTPTDGLQETRKFAQYYLNNYKTPQLRVGQLTIKSRRQDGSPNANATWTLLTSIDVSDIVHLKTTHGGGGGFNTDFYVEGIHYQARPGPGVPYIELTLDVSPQAAYASNPFG